MKRKTAKELLADSFRELAEGKNIDKITVQDIVENCGYSSATFYRQFKDKYDLIAWDYARSLGEIMQRMDRGDYEWKDTLIDGAKYYAEQKDYFANLLLHTSGYNFFVHYMTEIHINSLSKCILKSLETDKLDEATHMYISLYCQGTIGLTCAWILGKYNATPEELAKVYENSLPIPLQQYLCQE